MHTIELVFLYGSETFSVIVKTGIPYSIILHHPLAILLNRP